MSTDGQGTKRANRLKFLAIFLRRLKRRRKIAKNFNRLSSVHERYRQTTDGRAIAYSERERELLTKGIHIGLRKKFQSLLRSRPRDHQRVTISTD